MSVRVGISCGDLHGIGPEVIFKALARKIPKGIEINVYLPAGCFEKELLTLPEYVHHIRIGTLEEELKPGSGTASSAAWAMSSLDRATRDLLNGEIDVLVTAPIDKNAMQGVGFEYPGHTEYLASRAENNPFLMLLISEKLRMGTITGHIPIREVPDSLNPELIREKVEVLHRSLQMDFGIDEPKIAVLGLNPHAGDKGTIGNEEIDFIQGTVAELRSEFGGVEGPFPADGFFGTQQYQQFDATLSMYHDQGLVPFKTLSFGGGVNFTAGLPFVRTSPDHGTAFGIAGKNRADESSMHSAIVSGIQIVESRRR